MSQVSGREITLLIKLWAEGNNSVLDELIPAIYEELRQMAHRQMSYERSGHTLQSDALINEAFLRLIKVRNVDWQNRSHFLAYCAKIMRRILVDHARARCRLKRAGALKKTIINSSLITDSDADAGISRLDDALKSLAEIDKRKAKVVEMRFFGGFSVEETAEALGISVRTVNNEWKFSKVWLLRELESNWSSNESAAIPAN